MKMIMKFLDVIYYNFYLYYNNQKVHYIDPEMMPFVTVSNTVFDVDGYNDTFRH